MKQRSGATTDGGAVRLTWKHRLVLVGFGLFLVVLLELVLRIAGFGGRPPMLHPLQLSPPPAGLAAGARLYEIHPRLAALFFVRTGSGPEMLGSHRRELVVLPKPPGTFRIVLVGASTIEGFPMPRNLTSARFLDAMLQHAAPGRRVEVLNLGVTAIASFPIRKIAIEAMERLEPDVVVVYEAHNEFFGASGMASVQFMGRSPWSMEMRYQLRQLALSQVAEALLARPAVPSGDGDGWRKQLIQVMAAMDEIPPGGELHEAARRSLVANYRAIVREGRRRGIPVVLSTVVSNERDLVPVASFLGNLPPERRPDWERRFAEAEAAGARNPAAALELFRGLVAEAPRHAAAAYRFAQALEAAGRRSEAAEMYRRARDLDAMPWRASRDKNEAMRQLAAEEGAPLADCEAVFARASQGSPAPGATTWSLFFDHVHPSLQGQALLARAFLDTLVRNRLVPVDPARLASIPSGEEIASRLGANPLELYAQAHAMSTLFHSPPFAVTNQAAARRAERLLAWVRKASDPVDLEALRLWEEGSREAGLALPVSFFGGVAALRAGENERARRYLEAAAESAFPWSDERCAARLLSAVAAQRAGEEPRQLRQRIAAALREAEQVASLPDQPTPLLARTLAGLLYLAGDPARGAARQAEADRLAASAPAWQKPLLHSLPELKPDRSR